MNILLLLGILLAFSGQVFYIVQISQKKVRPHPITWLLWTLFSFVGFLAQWSGGAGSSSFITLTSSILCLITALLSLKTSRDVVTRFDVILGVLGLISIIAWSVTGTLVITVMILIGAEIIGYLPTYRKVWHMPLSEPFLPFVFALCKHLATLLSAAVVTFVTTGTSIALILLNAILILLIWFRRRFSTHSK